MAGRPILSFFSKSDKDKKSPKSFTPRKEKETVPSAGATAHPVGASEGPLKTVLFIGSTREGRNGLRVALFVQKQLEEAGHEVVVFDPVKLPFQMLTTPLHFYQDQSKVPSWLANAGRTISEADAFVVVSAEYNHSIPPALSNMLDHFPIASFIFKPSAIVCYSMGPFGGMRAAMQLRCMLGELGCISVSNILGIPAVHQALDPEGKPLDDRLIPGAKTLIGQLDWNARAMKTRRETHGIPK